MPEVINERAILVNLFEVNTYYVTEYTIGLPKNSIIKPGSVVIELRYDRFRQSFRDSQEGFFDEYGGLAPSESSGFPSRSKIYGGSVFYSNGFIELCWYGEEPKNELILVNYEYIKKEERTKVKWKEEGF